MWELNIEPEILTSSKTELKKPEVWLNSEQSFLFPVGHIFIVADINFHL